MPTLAAATTYWFGLHLSGNFDRDDIYWETTAFGNGNESDQGTFDNWFNNGNDHAFNLSGDTAASVPDAGSTAALLGLAFAGIGILKRRFSGARA